MKKKYVHFKRRDIYAAYFRDNKTIYYNLNFDFAETKIILIR